MANDLKQLAEQLVSTNRKLLEALSTKTNDSMKDSLKQMTVEDAKKFANFVKTGGLDSLINDALDKAKEDLKK